MLLAVHSDIGILTAKKTYLKPRVGGAAAALALILQLLLTPRYGIYGAAVATALTQVAIFTINASCPGGYKRWSPGSVTF